MKYLLLNGSPHKGNTWRISQFAKEHILFLDKEASFHEIHIASLQLPFCTGCSTCFRKGGDKCPHNQILRPLVQEMDHADAVILVSTTFFMRETALLKNVMDHLLYMTHRPHFFKKKALVITSTGGIGASAAAKGIASWLGAIGFNKTYLLPITTCSWNDYEPNQKAKKKIKCISEKFYHNVASGKFCKPSYGELIPYNLFRGMCRFYVPGTEYETADGPFWTDSIRAKRVYDRSIPVSLGQIIFGNLFYVIGRIAGKATVVTYKKQGTDKNHVDVGWFSYFGE